VLLFSSIITNAIILSYNTFQYKFLQNLNNEVYYEVSPKVSLELIISEISNFNRYHIQFQLSDDYIAYLYLAYTLQKNIAHIKI